MNLRVRNKMQFDSEPERKAVQRGGTSECDQNVVSAPHCGSMSADNEAGSTCSRAEPNGILLRTLNRYQVVVVRPKYSGNLGAIARVLANFEAPFGTLVQPICSINTFESRLYAMGPAREYLEKFKVVNSLTEALSSCEIAVGFTRRKGAARNSTLELSEIASLARGSRVALVFGSEDTGLLKEELLPCTHLCQIPTGRAMPSLNLSHSVAAVLSRVFQDELGSRQALDQPQARAKVESLESMFLHFHEFLQDIGMTTAGNPDRILSRIRRILHRAELSEREVRILRGILTKGQVALGSKSRGKRVRSGLINTFYCNQLQSPISLSDT